MIKTDYQEGVLAAKGFQVGVTAAGIKKRKQSDLVILTAPQGATAAGVFTRNQFAAAPVLVSRQHLQLAAHHRAIIINSGNANACTGDPGLQDAKAMCQAVAEKLGCPSQEVLVASTGVIGARMPMQRILPAIPHALNQGNLGTGLDAARAIMTTDTFPKQHSVAFKLRHQLVHIGGMAKGAGMIHPNMATMIAVITTDAKLDKATSASVLKAANQKTFNRISVDGQSSTNDTAFFMASGAAGAKARLVSATDRALFLRVLTEVMDALARMIVQDGEGASKVIEIILRGAHSGQEAEIGARAVGDSMLVKTAMHGQDANWGRIIQALGATSIRLNPKRVSISLNGCEVVRAGMDTGVPWADANRALRGREIQIIIDLGVGRAQAGYLVSDLTAKYIAINAGYRS